MKRNLLYCVLITISIIMYGCSNEPQKVNKQKVDQAKVLIDELNNINNELLADLQTRSSEMDVHPYLPEQPSKFNWKFALKVASRDALGAWRGARIGATYGGTFGPHSAVVGGVLGGLLLGTISSAVCYSSEQSMTIDTKNFDNPEYIYSIYLTPTDGDSAHISGCLYDENGNLYLNNILPIEYAEYEQIGIAHNILLSKLLTKDVTVNTAVIPMNDPNYDIIKSPEFISAYKTAVDEIINGNFLSELEVGNYEKYSFSPVASDVLKSFSELYIKYPQSVENVDFVINKYIECIEKTDNVLTEDDKRGIYAGLAVAAYSPRYWSEIDNTKLP